MGATNERRRRTHAALAAAGVLMVLCCAVGPTVLTAVAGSAIGDRLGLACAVILAGALGLILHRRTRSRGAC